MPTTPAESLPFKWQFVAGATAGIAEICTMYPLDVIKTRAQLSTSAAKPEGIFRSLVSIVQKEGALRLYRGILSPLLIEAPKRATKFAANDFYSKCYLKLFGMKQPTQALAVATGVSAGMTEAFLVISFELVKIRMQDKSLVGKYSGVWDCVRTIAAEEGILAFAKGLEPTLWRHAMWNGGYFGTIHYIRSLFTKYAPSVENKMARDFVCGAIGGTIGTILNTPFDVVKTRIQGTIGPHPRYSWAFPALVVIGREEGWRALWKGFLPKVLRLGPGGGILLVVYTQMLNFISRYLEVKE